jgi:multiple sugar transport system permease protein
MTATPAAAGSPKSSGGSGRSRFSGEGRTAWFMAGPAVFLLAMFLIAPFILAFVLSFTNQRLISPNPTEYVGTANYERLLTVQLLTLEPVLDEAGVPVLDETGDYTYPRIRTFTRDNPEYPQYDGLQEWRTIDVGADRLVILAGDATFLTSLINTFLFALFIVPAQGGLGLLLALIINRRIRGVNLFRSAYFIPVVISMVVVAILWTLLYAESGLVNQLLGAATFGLFPPLDWLGDAATSLASIMVMSVWQGVGFHMLIWLAGLQTIPYVLYEAAQIDGAGRWAQFRNVTWPGLRNTAVFVFIIITIQAFALFTQIDVMTQGGPLDSTQTVIFQAVQRGFERQDIAYGSAIAVVFFAMVLVVSLVQRWLSRDR